MKIEYEILEERDTGSSTSFKILYDIFDDTGKPLKRSTFGYSCGTGRAYQIVDYDKDGKGIPFWKQQVEASLQETLKNYELSFKTIPQELKPVLNKKYSIISEVSATPTKADDIDLLERLKFIGDEIAEALVNKFGTVEAVVNATKEELIKIVGIGKKNINKIYKEIQSLN